MKICIRLLGRSKPLYVAESGPEPTVHIQIPNKTAYVNYRDGILTVTLDSNAVTMNADEEIKVEAISPGGSLVVKEK